MHTKRNRFLFFGPTVLTGLSSLVLHQYMMEHCFDAKGLLITGNLPGRLMWVLGIAFVVYLIALLRTIGGDGSYEDIFPRCILSGGLMAAAGVVLLGSVSQLGLEPAAPVVETAATMVLDRLTALGGRVLPYGAGLAMIVLGLYRMGGKKPSCAFGAVVCLFYMLMLVTNYRLWSADSQVHTYAYQLLAGVTLMLCSFHRTCCDAGVIQRKKLLGTGMLALAACIASLSRDFMPGFFLASGLWAAGSMCSVAVLPPDLDEEDGEDEEDEEPAPEQPEIPGEPDDGWERRS